jgi:hypothetical protein
MRKSYFARLAIPKNLIETCPRAGQTMTPVSRVWHA